MDLFGSIMFPDSSGDTVPLMYLELVRDLEPDKKYNWGGAVLAHLYFNLYQSCQVSKFFLSYFKFLNIYVMANILQITEETEGYVRASNSTAALGMVTATGGGTCAE